MCVGHIEAVLPVNSIDLIRTYVRVTVNASCYKLVVRVKKTDAHTESERSEKVLSNSNKTREEKEEERAMQRERNE